MNEQRKGNDMNENRAKIALKIGHLEVEYEGSETFLKEDIFRLMEKVVGFQAKHSTALSAAPPQATTKNEDSTVGQSEINMSTSTIATRLNAKSGPELAIAAAAHLALVQKKEKFSRDDIHENMKAAPSYYKKNMSKNLTTLLQSLVKSERLNQISDGHYALSAPERKKMENNLAEHV